MTATMERKTKRRMTGKPTPLCPQCGQRTHSRKVGSTVRTCYCMNENCPHTKGIKQSRG